MTAVEPTGPGITRTTSDVRLCGAVRKMGNAQTLTALAAIKDAAKGGLLERDMPKLKEAYEKRKQYLRSIAPTTPITTQGTP